MTHGGEIDHSQSPAARADAAALDPFSLVTAEDTPNISAISTPPLVATIQSDAPKPVVQESEGETFNGIVEIPHPLIPGDEAAEAESDATGPSSFAPADTSPSLPPTRGSGWTIPMLCIGAALIAMCVLLPLANENHQLVYQREKLKLDLVQINKQVAVNDEFIKRIGDDPTLAERLAQRQMRTIRQGTSVLDLSDQDASQSPNREGSSLSSDNGNMSPFMLVTVPPPPEMAPYKRLGGPLARFCDNPQRRLCTMGIGLFLMAAGLVLGAVPQIPWRLRKSFARDADEDDEINDKP